MTIHTVVIERGFGFSLSWIRISSRSCKDDFEGYRAVFVDGCQALGNQHHVENICDLNFVQCYKFKYDTSMYSYES